MQIIEFILICQSNVGFSILLSTIINIFPCITAHLGRLSFLLHGIEY